jgi:5,10-methylenetetrahydrofolate reductase
MTQILFDLSYLEAFFERFGGPSPIPLLVGIWPLRSHQLAQRLHNEVPGIVVPDHVQQALLDAGPERAGRRREPRPRARGAVEGARRRRLRRRAVPTAARRVGLPQIVSSGST